MPSPESAEITVPTPVQLYKVLRRALLRNPDVEFTDCHELEISLGDRGLARLTDDPTFYGLVSRQHAQVPMYKLLPRADHPDYLRRKTRLYEAALKMGRACLDVQIATPPDTSNVYYTVGVPHHLIPDRTPYQNLTVAGRSPHNPREVRVYESDGIEGKLVSNLTQAPLLVQAYNRILLPGTESESAV